jgi:hypothetical protein
MTGIARFSLFRFFALSLYRFIAFRFIAIGFAAGR